MRIYSLSVALLLAACGVTPKSIASPEPSSAILSVHVSPTSTEPRVDGSAFRVVVHGHGPPMILIPGFACSGAVWDDLIARYEDQYTLHAVTLAGFAGAAPNGTDQVMPAARKQLARYIAENRLTRPVVVGHSMGGVIALDLAAKHPELVGALVILDSLPFLPAAFTPIATSASTRENAEAMRDSIRTQTPSQRRLFEEPAIASMVTNPAKAQVALEWAMASDAATMGQAMYEVMTTDLRPEMTQIQAPTLVVATWQGHGMASDRGLVTRSFEAQYRDLRGVKIAMAAHARHFVMWDEPEWLYGQIDHFLAASSHKAMRLE